MTECRLPESNKKLQRKREREEERKEIESYVEDQKKSQKNVQLRYRYIFMKDVIEANAIKRKWKYIHLLYYNSSHTE